MGKRKGCEFVDLLDIYGYHHNSIECGQHSHFFGRIRNTQPLLDKYECLHYSLDLNYDE